MCVRVASVIIVCMCCYGSNRETSRRLSFVVLVHSGLRCPCKMDSSRCAKLTREDVYVDKQFLKDFTDFNLGLEKNASFEFRIYILECKGPRGEKVWYCGIVHFSELRARMRKHFEGLTIHYTKIYKAVGLVYLWTAPTEASEAYVYHEMLRRMDANSAWKLGGFTQTSSRPSRLDCLLAEQARRGMCELCFNCGQRRFQGEHLRLRKCPHPLRGVEYECPAEGCSGKLLVTSRGHAEQVPEPPARLALAESVALPSTRKRPPPAAAEPQPARKVSKTAASTSKGLQVRICGESYTALSWFLNNANPSKNQTAQARTRCHDGAVELSGAHVRALTGTVYAKAPPARPKPLCLVRGGRERDRLGEGSVGTEIAGLTIERAQGALSKRCSQILLRVDTSLEEAFSKF